jgi:hypothetical protein
MVPVRKYPFLVDIRSITSYLVGKLYPMMMKKLCILTLMCVSMVNANAQFKAKMINTVQGNERIYTVYSSGDMYRYEFEEGGEKGVVIVKPEENKSYILMPSKKFVHITECDGAMSRMNDPWQSYLWFSKFGEEKTIENQTLEGTNVVVKAAYQGESKVFTCYFSEKLNFPVKIQSNMEENTFMRLENIEPWKTISAYFMVPEGYTEVDRRMRPIVAEPPPPASWTDIKGSIPFEGSLQRGEKMWLTVPASVYYTFRINNTTDSPGKIIYHLYRDKTKLGWEEQGKDKYRTIRLFPGESKTLTQNWEAGLNVLLEVYEGTLEIAVMKE